MKFLTVHSYIFIAYIIFSAFFSLSIMFKERPRNRIIGAVIVFWIMTFNFYKSPMMWLKLPYLWYLRQADFLFAWYLAIILALVKLSVTKNKDKVSLPAPSYEKYLYLYFFFCIGMFGLHYFLGNISQYKTVSFIRLYFDSFLIYYSIKHFMSRELIRMLLQTFIVMGIITSFASVIQFYIDTDFLRVGYYHMAYPGHNRSSGLFYYAYDNGLFTILATYSTVYFLRDWRIKTPLILLYLVSLFLVFTRGTWIAFVFIFLFHMLYFYRERFKRVLVGLSAVIVLLFMITGAYYAQKEFFTGEYTERVKSDTVTVRMAFYAFVLQAIPQKPFLGYGDVENNNVYFKGMVNAEQSLFWALGKSGGIHNLFLEEAFLRGIFSPIILSIAFISFFFFSIRMAVKKRSYVFLIPAYFNAGFFLYFMSVSGFLISRSGMLSIPIFAIVSGIYYNNINLSGIIVESEFHIRDNYPAENSDIENLNGADLKT